MSASLFNCLKRMYLSLSRFPAIRNAREWWRVHVQLHWWPWYDRPPTKFGLELNPAAYKHELIVSLTSYPARIHLAQYAVSSILKQSLKPNRVILWLGEDKFPNKEADLPDGLLALRKFGLEIRWCRDVRAFTKLVYALRDFPDALLVTADDDYHYPRHWIRSLYRSWLADEHSIHTGVVHQITFDANGFPATFENWSWWHVSGRALFRNTHNGSSGALYPPRCLHPDVTDLKTYQHLSAAADDLWTWAMAVRANTRVMLVREGRVHLALNPRVASTPELWTENSKGGGNTRCFFNLLQAYPEITQKLRKECSIPD